MGTTWRMEITTADKKNYERILEKVRDDFPFDEVKEYKDLNGKMPSGTVSIVFRASYGFEGKKWAEENKIKHCTIVQWNLEQEPDYEWKIK